MDIEEKNCQSCRERNSCKEVYKKLGQNDTPPMALKAVFAFLLPLLIFIAVLFIAEKLLQNRVKPNWVVIFISFLAALLATLIYVLLAKSFINKNGKTTIYKEDRDGNTSG